MIRYALKCADGHGFDSWFQSAGAYDSLSEKGMVSCAVCGSADVSKAIMAPRVTVKEDAAPLSAPSTPAEQALRAMRAELEKNADYVGETFATEARAIHVGDAPERPIWGQANLKEAKALVEEGVPIAPIPFGPPRKTN